MIYSLYHKNIEVLKADYNPSENKFNSIIEVKNEKHIPVGVNTIPNYSFEQGLTFWWQSRLIPKNRRNYSNPEVNLQEIFKESYGFNLSDQYWVKNIDSTMTWEKGNFLLNDFNEDIGKYLINSNENKIKNMSSNTPDLFSNGNQDKRWVIENKKRLLLKYGRPPYYEQPFNEMLATEICRRLDIQHVNYSFVIKGKTENIKIYSSCPCFINENTEFVPAGFVQYAVKKEKQESEYEHLIRCCEKLGMKNMEKIKTNIAQMIVLDYLCANVDRHYGNFGFIRDVNTLEWQGLAPNFDTGNAMFYEYPTSDLRKSSGIMENVPSKNFNSSQKKQLTKFATEAVYLNIDFSKLKGIDTYYKTILSKNPKVDNERIELLGNLLVERIEKCKKIIFSKNKITQSFLKELKENIEDKSFIKKVSELYINISKTDVKKKAILDSFFSCLNTKDEKDFELKLKKEIISMKKNKAIEQGISM